MTTYSAKHKNADISPRKVREFADLIRGKLAEEAMEELSFFHNRGARMLAKVVASAMGNAESREEPDMDALEVIEARVDGGPMMKRIRPRARGMAFLIKKRFCHIIVTLGVPEDDHDHEHDHDHTHENEAATEQAVTAGAEE